MNKPKFYKVYLTNFRARLRTIQFPNGKEITILRGKPYITSDAEELKFLAKQRFLSITYANAMELQNWVYSPEALPHILHNMTKDDERVKKWKFSSVEERMIANAIKKVGRQLPDDFFELGNTVSEKVAIQRSVNQLKKLGYTVIAPDEKTEEPKTEEVKVEDKPKPTKKKTTKKKAKGK